MPLSKQPNRPPNDIETTKLNEWIAQEEAILASIRKLEREREQERVRFLKQSSLLRSTLRSTKVVQDVASKMFSNNSLLLKKLEEEIAYQEAEISAISECFPSTHDFIKELKDIALFGTSLQLALKKQLGCIGSRIDSVDGKLESTVDLQAYIDYTISSASTMASEAEGTIQKKTSRTPSSHPSTTRGVAGRNFSGLRSRREQRMAYRSLKNARSAKSGYESCFSVPVLAQRRITMSSPLEVPSRTN